MPIEVKKQASIPNGKHEGMILEARETTTIFNPAEGPEDILEIVIQPKWRQDKETETLPVSVSFTPVLNGLSALSKFLDRLGQSPKIGTTWEPETLVGTEISFDSKNSSNGFPRIDKESIRLVKKAKATT